MRILWFIGILIAADLQHDALQAFDWSPHSIMLFLLAGVALALCWTFYDRAVRKQFVRELKATPEWRKMEAVV